jgi:hypothetical protein
MKKKEKNELGLMLIFLSTFPLYWLARHIYSGFFHAYTGMNSISIEAFDHIKYFVETSFNIFFVVLALYLGAMYYLMKKQKNNQAS